ncbi:stage II sporulation protein M [Clostridium psychrophilum]|uniref:stage II sporulation protein M n=1 Tax=Clostridium psychrophilum TaxID=132926 RepID=UPI001C0DE6E0|nr:stage II sporulation protein M [Clostridium psychrophilum]MBU3182550.1 stage II sporulation protein M [Clostridium psychrophilum]
MQVCKNKNIKLTWYVTLGLFILFTIIGYNTGSNTLAKIKFTVVNYGFNEIFFNNSKIAIYNYIGIISFGSFNFFSLVTNGISLGSTLNSGIKEFGLYTSLLKFVPHAIFELPAMIISMSVGFLPIAILISKSKKNNCAKVKITYYLKYVVYSFIFVIFLDLIAAVVESSISMRF